MGRFLNFLINAAPSPAQTRSKVSDYVQRATHTAPPAKQQQHVDGHYAAYTRLKEAGERPCEDTHLVLVDTRFDKLALEVFWRSLVVRRLLNNVRTTFKECAQLCGGDGK